jgi:hypothetical protein
MLVEAAIKNETGHVSKAFACTNATLKDPASGLRMCLHLYCKLLPWDLVARCMPPALRSADLSRLANEARDHHLPVLAIESTDRNRTDWTSLVQDRNVADILAFIRASPIDTKGRVHVLYPPGLFLQERFYLYDLFFYSRPLFDLTGCSTPFWWLCQKSAFGVPPLGMGITKWDAISFTPASSIAPVEWETAQELAQTLPHVQGLTTGHQVPLADLWAAERAEALGGALHVTETQDVYEDVEPSVPTPVFVRWGQEESEDVVHAVRERLDEAPWKVVKQLIVPVLGEFDRQCVFLVSRRRREARE